MVHWVIHMKPQLPRLRCQTESRYVQTIPDGKCLCPDPPRRKVSMSRPSQTESVYVQTLPDGKCLCPDPPRRKVPMSRPSQTESVYVQTLPDGKCLCPDPPRRKVSMSRPSQTESAYVQTFVRSKFFVRSSCVQKSSCPDFRAFKIAYVHGLATSMWNIDKIIFDYFADCHFLIHAQLTGLSVQSSPMQMDMYDLIFSKCGGRSLKKNLLPLIIKEILVEAAVSDL